MRRNRLFCLPLLGSVGLLMLGIVLTNGCSKGESKKKSETAKENVVQEMNIPKTDDKKPEKKGDEKEPDVGMLPFGSDSSDDSAAPSLNAPG